MSDTIYKDEAVKICEKWRDRANKVHDRNGWYIADIISKQLAELPPTNRLQGVWLIDESLYTYRCSICGTREESFIYGTEDWYGYGLSNFCPYCGAKMSKVNNE